MAADKTEKPEKFEDAFARLDAIVAKLETGEAELEESIELYAEGMTLVQFCGRKLNAAAQRIERLTAAVPDANKD